MGCGAAKPLAPGPYRHYEQDGVTFREKFIHGMDDAEKLYNADPTEHGRARLGRMLEDSFILSLCDTVAEEVASERYKDQKRCKILQRAMGTLQKLTKCSEEVAAIVMRYAKVVPVLLQKLGKRWAELEMNKCFPYMDEEKNILVPASLHILHNISTYEQHVPALRKLGADGQSTGTARPQELPAIIDVMWKYLNSERQGNRLVAIAVLANITKDNLTETTSPVILAFLVKAASDALGNPDLTYEGWTAGQLLHVLRTLGQKHLVKMALVKAGILDLLEKSIKSSAEDIREESRKVLWDLSFDNNCAKMVADRALIVKSLQKEAQRAAAPKSSDHEADTTSDGLQTMNSGAEEAKGILMCLPLEPLTETKEAPHWDFFLSYNWSYQPTVKKLYDLLIKNNFRVWMDRKKMQLGECLSEGIADGIARSAVFILCACTKYAKSHVCKTEARYAFKRETKIIPLHMEKPEDIKHYPWLDMIIGPRLYADFSESHTDDGKFSKNAKKVLKALTFLTKKQSHVSAEPQVETQTADSSRQKDEPTTQLPLKAAQDPEKQKPTGLRLIRVTPTNRSRGMERTAQLTSKIYHNPPKGKTPKMTSPLTRRMPNILPREMRRMSVSFETDEDRSVRGSVYMRYESQLQRVISVSHSGELRRTEGEGTQMLRARSTRHSLDEERIRSWRREEIQDWLNRSGLKSPRFNPTYQKKCNLQMYHCPTCWARFGMQKKTLDKLTGDDLVFLQNLRHEAPEMFYEVLRKSLQIQNLTGMSKFIKALESLETE